MAVTVISPLAAQLVVVVPRLQRLIVGQGLHDARQARATERHGLPGAPARILTDNCRYGEGFRRAVGRVQSGIPGHPERRPSPLRYVISCDLQRPRQSYDQLYAALRKFGAQPLLASQWIVRRDGTTAATIKNIIRGCVDADDRLLVTCLDSNDWARWNTMADPNTV